METNSKPEKQLEAEFDRERKMAELRAWERMNGVGRHRNANDKANRQKAFQNKVANRRRKSR
jgi:hypothetical protein